MPAAIKRSGVFRFKTFLKITNSVVKLAKFTTEKPDTNRLVSVVILVEIKFLRRFYFSVYFFGCFRLLRFSAYCNENRLLAISQPILSEDEHPVPDNIYPISKCRTVSYITGCILDNMDGILPSSGISNPT